MQLIPYATIVIFVLHLFSVVQSHQMLELESNTFEVTLTAFQYIAILFYDHSEKAKQLEKNWDRAAELVGDKMPKDCQMAKVRLCLHYQFHPIFIHSFFIQDRWNG
jgi:hypothetical protein